MSESWSRFASALSASLSSGSLIVASWHRSEAAGVRRDDTPSFRSVPDDELAARLSANRLLVDVATPHLRWLSRLFQDRRHVAYVVDADGIVLVSFGDAVLIQTCGLSPGNDWSESVMGTNGAGTALAARAPVAVIGGDHWHSAWQDVTCLASPILGADGRALGAIDVSMEVQEGDAERLLLVAHAGHTIAQEFRRREAEAASLAKDRIIATVSHELRQPIQAALAAVHVMQARQSRASGEHARETLAKQLQQMSRLVDDLVEGASVVHGSVHLRCAITDLRTVVEESCDGARPLTVAHEFSQDLPQDPVPVNVDAARIQQVLMNVIANAVKFTAHGGRIALTLSTTGNEARISVRDTGRGIDPALMPHIFELFTRTPEQKGGFGVGLAVARRLVELQGGTLEAYSQGLGHGSEFVVRLPLVVETGAS